MAHVTSNATWVDYPSTATLVTAAKLEAIENVGDALYTSEYGSLTRAARPFFRMHYAGSYVQTANTDMVWSNISMVVDKDTDSGWGNANPTYYQIPISGRLWDLYMRLTTGALGSGVTMACKIMLNGTSVATNSIGSDARVGTGGESHCNAVRYGVGPLTAGDKIYWATWATGTPTYAGIFGGVFPEVVVRDAGPA
jgi:hypothetical protein